MWKGQVGGGPGQNMEGLTLGPPLPGGNWSLLGVVDNSGGSDPFSANTLMPFVLTPTVPGDFNGNGAVDAADYVLWRNGLGTIYTTGDYSTWRAHFGQSAGGGSAAGSSTTAALPEPTTLAVLITGMLPTFCRRRR